jgi:hypothetical protein
LQSGYFDWYLLLFDRNFLKLNSRQKQGKMKEKTMISIPQNRLLLLLTTPFLMPLIFGSLVAQAESVSIFESLQSLNATIGLEVERFCERELRIVPKVNSLKVQLASKHDMLEYYLSSVVNFEVNIPGSGSTSIITNEYVVDQKLLLLKQLGEVVYYFPDSVSNQHNSPMNSKRILASRILSILFLPLALWGQGNEGPWALQ